VVRNVSRTATTGASGKSEVTPQGEIQPRGVDCSRGNHGRYHSDSSRRRRQRPADPDASALGPDSNAAYPTAGDVNAAARTAGYGRPYTAARTAGYGRPYTAARTAGYGRPYTAARTQADRDRQPADIPGARYLSGPAAGA